MTRDKFLPPAEDLANAIAEACAVLREHLDGRIGANDPNLVDLLDRLESCICGSRP